MNRNLLLFDLFLIILGIGFNFYLISLFGFLLLIPAFMSPSRAPPRPGSSTVPRDVPRRVSQAPRPQAVANASPQAPRPSEIAVTPPSMSSSYQSYSPALFPNPLFPSLSLAGTPNLQAPEAGAKKTPEKDELVEAGTMLALLRLLLG